MIDPEDLDDLKQGFLRTRYTARFWFGPIQVQVWRPRTLGKWDWVIAWNGDLFQFDVGSGAQALMSAQLMWKWGHRFTFGG